MDFIVIDFEIANENLNSACSVGLVFVEDTEIVDKKHYYIQPPMLNFNPSMVEIHGITEDDVRYAETFKDIWLDIEGYFDGSVLLVAHNAQFDMSVLHACLKEYGLEFPDFLYVDSIAVSDVVCKESGIGRSLKDRVDYFGVDLVNHHDALEDAVATAELVRRCIYVEGRHSLEDFVNVFWSIKVKAFSELNPLKYFYGKKAKGRFNKVNIKEIVPTVSKFNETHVFYGKAFVFTGALHSLDRKTAMEKVVDTGGILKSSVSRKVDYVVVGIQDSSIVGKDGLSGKQRKAYELIEKGVDIKILTEDEFLRML